MYFLIIENDSVWQLKIQKMLEGFQDVIIETAATFNAAALFLAKTSPDLVLTEVVLPDGISFDLFKTVSPTYPIVFFTDTPDDSHFQQALSFAHTTFLVKPFHHFTLRSAIHCVTNKFQSEAETIPSREEGIWVNDKYRQKIMIPFKEIIYIEGEGNYVTIHTTVEHRYVIKTSLRKVSELLEARFIQIHRRFIVNRDFINRIDRSAGKINVKMAILPIGRSFQKYLLTIISQQHT